MTETIPEFFNRFLAPHFPEVTYRLNGNGLGSGTQHNKEEILRVAGKLFQGSSDQIIAHQPVDLPVNPPYRVVPFHANDKSGKVEIKGRIASKAFSGDIPEEVAVTFDEKIFNCRFSYKQGTAVQPDGAVHLEDITNAVCTAKDHQKQVVVGGQWISSVPYALFFGAVCYSAHSVVEGVQLCRSILKAVSSAVPQNPSGKQDIVKSAKLILQILRNRNKIQISKKETLGEAVNRIRKRLLKAGLLSTAAVAILVYDVRYVRV